MKPHKMVIKLIQEGGATDSSLIEKIGLKDKKALDIQFKVLREYLDLYPMQQEDGTYVLLDEDTYNLQEGIKAEKKKKVQQQRKEAVEFKKLLEKDPQLKYDSAIRKRETAITKLDTATLKLGKLPQDQLLQWKKQVAYLNYCIADLELNQLKARFNKFYKMSNGDLENLRIAGKLNSKANELLGVATNSNSEA